VVWLVHAPPVLAPDRGQLLPPPSSPVSSTCDQACTVIVTTVDPVQVVDDSLPETEHDFSVDLIVTPDEVIECGPPRRPSVLYWDHLTEDKIAPIPVLNGTRLQPQGCRLADPPEPADRQRLQVRARRLGQGHAARSADGRPRSLATELRRQAFFAFKRSEQQISGLICQGIFLQPLQHDCEQHIIHAICFYHLLLTALAQKRPLNGSAIAEISAF
jgi:hypothetical protein